MITIGFVGDIALTHSYEALYGVKGPHYPFERIQEILSRHDALIGNLEAPFTLGGEPYPFKVSLKSHPGYATGLKEAGFTVMSLANNHILDYREQALYDTIGLLDSQGIMWCGAGISLEEARRPAVMEKNGVSVGVLARCDVTIDSPFYASEKERGIAPLDLEELESAVRSLKREVHIVAAYLHWGREDWRYPSPEQVRTARRIIDMGADLVIGHHPHVLQGAEKYRRGYIAYSLGNFLFSDLDWRWVDGAGEVRRSVLKPSRARRLTAVLSVSVSRDGVEGAGMTGCLSGRDLRVAEVKRPGLFSARMRMLSAPISMGRYDLFWTVYTLAYSRWLQSLYQMKRLRKAYKIGPYLARRIYPVLPAVRDSLLKIVSSPEQGKQSQNIHRARSGTLGDLTGSAAEAGEDRAGSRERGEKPPGGTVRKPKSFGTHSHKKKRPVVT